MSATLERTAVTINLGLRCCDSELATILHEQMSAGPYAWPCSTMTLPETIEEWEAGHRTARKRAARCESDGYRFEEIERSFYADDVFEINTSLPTRQGRPMSGGYLERPSFTPLPSYECERHALRTYGVLDPDDRLRAYTWVYRAGDLVMFSSILGHADHLGRHVMYLLIRGALAAQIQAGPGTCFYGMHDSGGEGLTWFKERVGFQATQVVWELA